MKEIKMDMKSLEEIWPEEFGGASYGLSVVVMCAMAFYLLSRVVESLIPVSAKHTPWKWKNITISLVHSTISGFWTLLCFYDTPKLAEDMIQTHSVLSHTLISFSVGYFIYDVFEMLVNQRNRQSFELIGHHVVIIICFTIAIVTRMYVGYAVVALVVELNSTFVIFRISIMAWMSRWIIINKDLIPLVFYTLGSIGLAVMTVMNIILFYRLLRSDFIRKNKESATIKED